MKSSRSAQGVLHGILFCCGLFLIIILAKGASVDPCETAAITPELSPSASVEPSFFGVSPQPECL